MTLSAWVPNTGIAAVAVIVAVAVDVIDTVAVAVHVHGNDTVIVIRPVDGVTQL